ncbi:hypothetical protein C8N26_0062 [Tenacibaculum lutimaris]|uniref:Uncharacterized protein n=1 Tax=Tenacibaculum lutimaris TaxID=285258 RepID=A0A420E3I9_9FLAO|nr:hypothetical protein [Tenacibaculum lutimaris]RKF04676.1 hypothetical protein C8N26_0062 [Tenacibaculum lutimaris]
MKEIGVGLIIGLTFTTTILILKAKTFTQLQKIFLTFCFLFPPAQWILAMLLFFFNKKKLSLKSKLKIQKTTQNTVPQSIEDQKENLLFLLKKGILTEIEYQEKINLIKNKSILKKVHTSTEYKSLKKVYDSKLLTKEHFDNKVNVLVEKHKEYVSLFGDNNYSEFNWRLFYYIKLNSKIKTEDYDDNDFLGIWNFKSGQIYFDKDDDSLEKKVVIKWDNGISRFGKWSLNENKINLNLNKNSEINKITLNIEEIGTNIISYTMGNVQYIGYKLI